MSNNLEQARNHFIGSQFDLRISKASVSVSNNAGDRYTITEINGSPLVLDADGDPIKMLFANGVEAAEYVEKALRG